MKLCGGEKTKKKVLQMLQIYTKNYSDNRVDEKKKKVYKVTVTV